MRTLVLLMLAPALIAAAPAGAAPFADVAVRPDAGVTGIRAAIHPHERIAGQIIATLVRRRSGALTVTGCRAGRCVTASRTVTLRAGRSTIRSFDRRIPLSGATRVRVRLRLAGGATLAADLGLPTALPRRRFGVRAFDPAPVTVGTARVRATTGGALGASLTVAASAAATLESVATSSCGARSCPVARLSTPLAEGRGLRLGLALRPARPAGAGRLRLRMTVAGSRATVLAADLPRPG